MRRASGFSNPSKASNFAWEVSSSAGVVGMHSPAVRYQNQEHDEEGAPGLHGVNRAFRQDWRGEVADGAPPPSFNTRCAPARHHEIFARAIEQLVFGMIFTQPRPAVKAHRSRNSFRERRRTFTPRSCA